MKRCRAPETVVSGARPGQVCAERNGHRATARPGALRRCGKRRTGAGPRLWKHVGEPGPARPVAVAETALTAAVRSVSAGLSAGLRRAFRGLPTDAAKTGETRKL
jgi:hypothetical protein